MKNLNSLLFLPIMMLISFSSRSMESEPRPYEEVMQAIRNNIPNTENGLIKSLDYIIDYQAPELWWEETSTKLQLCLGPSGSLSGWQKTVFEIYTGKVDYKEYLVK